MKKTKRIITLSIFTLLLLSLLFLVGCGIAAPRFIQSPPNDPNELVRLLERAGFRDVSISDGSEWSETTYVLVWGNRFRLGRNSSQQDIVNVCYFENEDDAIYLYNTQRYGFENPPMPIPDGWDYYWGIWRNGTIVSWWTYTRADLSS